jgi:hypothetical protein
MANTVFTPLDDYLPNRRYSLLPFRFDRWDDGRVFITNEVGESLTLSANDFDNFVSKRLRPLFGAISPAHIVRFLGKGRQPTAGRLT